MDEGIALWFIILTSIYILNKEYYPSNFRFLMGILCLLFFTLNYTKYKRKNQQRMTPRDPGGFDP